MLKGVFTTDKHRIEFTENSLPFLPGKEVVAIVYTKPINGISKIVCRIEGPTLTAVVKQYKRYFG